MSLRQFQHKNGRLGRSMPPFRPYIIEVDIASPQKSTYVYDDGARVENDWWTLERILERVTTEELKEIFPTKYYLHATGGAFGVPPAQLYCVARTGDKCVALNADGSTEPLHDLVSYLEKFAAYGSWKEVDEQTAKAALQPKPKVVEAKASPAVRRFQLKNGPFGSRENPYHFESDENGKGWWVYASGYRSPADAYRTLEKALKWVADGYWVEIAEAPTAPPVAKAPPAPESKAGWFVCSERGGHARSFTSQLEAEKHAREKLEEMQLTYPLFLYKPVKSFTLVQNAPTVEEKTL